jgi:hypothetical protein
MHDLDRTTLELGHEELEFGEYEGEGEGMFELEGESPFSEAEAMELASELLAVTSEAELNYFLGDLLKKGFSAVKGIANSSVGRALGSVLKPLAKAALPIAGGALGGLIGGPAGAALGGSLASKAGSLFGLELEGLSQEDREFETAKQLTHLAGAAARHAVEAAASHPNASPHAIAQHAIAKAAQTYAPALLHKANGAAAVAPVGATHLHHHLRRVGAGNGQAAAAQAQGIGALHPSAFQSQASGVGAAHPAAFNGHAPAPGGLHPGIVNVNGSSGPAIATNAPHLGSDAPAHLGQHHHHQGVTAQGRWYRRGNRIVIVGA